MKAREKTVDKSSERVRKMFGEIAPKYDFLNNLLSVGLAPLWRRRLATETLKRIASRFEREGRSSADAVVETLDAATGTGDAAIELGRRWNAFSRRGALRGATLRRVGIDFSPEMLALARRKAPDVEFVEADGCALPFESNRFDAATISFGLRNMVDPAQGIAEMARVCKPGGVVAILEFSPSRFPIFAPIFRFYFHRILPKIGQRIAKNDSDAYNYLPASVDAFDSPERVLEYMRDSGLSNARRYSMTFGVLGLFIGEKKAEED